MNNDWKVLPFGLDLTAYIDGTPAQLVFTFAPGVFFGMATGITLRSANGSTVAAWSPEGTARDQNQLIAAIGCLVRDVAVSDNGAFRIRFGDGLTLEAVAPAEVTHIVWWASKGPEWGAHFDEDGLTTWGLQGFLSDLVVGHDFEPS